MMSKRTYHLFLFSALACIAVLFVGFLCAPAAADGTTLQPTVSNTFSPSNARTEDGKLIPTSQFFSAKRCAGCHQDTHTAWSESLHRNSGREPFYKDSVDILERTSGSELTQHCESCHAPVSVLSGALQKGSKELRTMDDEGVTCSVCHSITEARLDGTGSYTIRRPALLERDDGTPVYGEVSDAAIMADIPGHRRAVMRPLLKTPEFCGTCHKSAVTPTLNNYKFLRGFSAYDEWQQSAASRETVAPFYKRDHRAECRTCHMPRIAAENDVAAKNGTISSHRWLGANTATPLFYQQTHQVELTEKFLRDNVLSVDIFALRREANGTTVAPLNPSAQNSIDLQPADEVTAEVVVFNRKAAHSFPPELRDMYEPWVEFEVLDRSGKTIFHSGFIKPDGTLDESAHVYKSILLDESGRSITRHQVWLARVKAYDNAISPGRSDIARYRFRIPKDDRTGSFTPLKLRARVQYRRFIQEYTDYVLKRHNATKLNMPVVQMAEAEVEIVPRGQKGKKSPEVGLSQEQQARRWNDYGIGLLEQAQYGQACEAFRRASELNPRDPDPLISAAIAEMRTERYGPEREQLHKALPLLDAALKLQPTNVDPTHARARFFKALVMRGMGQLQLAADELTKVASEYPRDREVQRQLGQTLYSLGRISEAQVAFEALLGIDPNDAGAYQFLSPIYLSKSPKEAERAHRLYLLWRDDPLADVFAERFFGTHPEWAEERIAAHVHGGNSELRPTLSAPFAAPDR
jgi:tetratricopeptide (TPR) repeat protein